MHAANSIIKHHVEKYGKQLNQSFQPRKKKGKGTFEFNWDKTRCSKAIDFKSNNKDMFLKVKDNFFRTVIGDKAMHGGVYYWEIWSKSMTQRHLKIGVTSKRDYPIDSYGFSDFQEGFAFFGNGELRHNSNQTGEKYGTQVMKQGSVGCFLNMNKGTLSFSINGIDQGVAFRHPFLKVGPLYPAVALLHEAGCLLKCGMSVPDFQIY